MISRTDWTSALNGWSSSLMNASTVCVRLLVDLGGVPPFRDCRSLMASLGVYSGGHRTGWRPSAPIEVEECQDSRMLYTTIKLLHILLAITAIGFNASYAIWLTRVGRLSREINEFALRGVQFMDARIANPAYGLLLVTGLLMVFMGPWNLTTRWIDAALFFFVILILMGVFGYTPALRNQIKALETDGPDSAAYRAAANRQNVIGILFAIPILVILYLMVFKPVT